MSITVLVPDRPDTPPGLRGKRFTIGQCPAGFSIDVYDACPLAQSDMDWLVDLIRPAVEEMAREFGGEVELGRPYLLNEN